MGCMGFVGWEGLRNWLCGLEWEVGWGFEELVPNVWCFERLFPSAYTGCEDGYLGRMLKNSDLVPSWT